MPSRPNPFPIKFTRIPLPPSAGDREFPPPPFKPEPPPRQVPLGVDEIHRCREKWQKENRAYPRKHFLEPPLPFSYDDGTPATWYEIGPSSYRSDRDMVPESSDAWAVMRAHYFALEALSGAVTMHNAACCAEPREIVVLVQEYFVALAENIQEGLRALEGHEAAIPTPVGQAVTFDGRSDRTAIRRALNWSDDFLCMVYVGFLFSAPRMRKSAPRTPQDFWEWYGPREGPPLAAHWTPKTIAAGCTEWAIKRIGTIRFPSNEQLSELRAKMEGDLAAAERECRAKSPPADVKDKLPAPGKGAAGPGSGASARRNSRVTKSDPASASAMLRWKADAPDFIPAAEAVKLTDGKLKLPALSKALRPGGPVRYMRKGQRCKVHVQDFRKYAFSVGPDMFSEEAFEKYYEECEARKAEIRKSKEHGK